jgi:asparagine synthetase B (glutamine-hydrolysing)
MAEQQSHQTPDQYQKYANLFELVENTLIVGEENAEWSPEELDTRLRVAMQKAGEACAMANDGTIYLTLSGGIDSTLALAILRELHPDQRIVTVVMGGSPGHDDVQFAQLAAETFKSEHYVCVPDKDAIFDGVMKYKEVSRGQDLHEAMLRGDDGDSILYSYLSEKLGAKAVISCDGIDEQLGGYPGHRWGIESAESKKQQFDKFWGDLLEGHLKPLVRIADSLDIRVIFPYLDADVIDYSSHIPLDERTTKDESKIPLRTLARWHKVPEEIIQRRKRGRLDMLKQE